MTPTSYTFRIEHVDGTTVDRVVPLTFDDLPADLTGRLAFLNEEERVAALLAYRLDVPLEAAQTLVDELNSGNGIVEA